MGAITDRIGLHIMLSADMALIGARIALGIGESPMFTAGALASLATGIIVDRTRSFTPAFLVSAVAALAGAASYWTVRRVAPTPAYAGRWLAQPRRVALA